MKFAEDVGVRLLERDQTGTKVGLPNGQVEAYEILHNFPFSSETKRMGIIVRNRGT